MEELGLGPEGRWDFPSAPRLSLPCQGRGLSPSCWTGSLEGLGPGWPVPFKHVFSPLLATAGSVLKQGARAQQRCDVLPAQASTALLKLSLGVSPFIAHSWSRPHHSCSTVEPLCRAGPCGLCTRFRRWAMVQQVSGLLLVHRFSKGQRWPLPPPTSPSLGLGSLHIKQLSVFTLVIKLFTTLEKRIDVNSEHVNKEVENKKIIRNEELIAEIKSTPEGTADQVIQKDM